MQGQLNLPARKATFLDNKKKHLLKREYGDIAVGTERKEILRFLRDYDLRTKYGPCIGMSRRERMERAVNILKTDREYLAQVKTYLNAYAAGDSEISEPLWSNVDPKP
ncbi:hypothetical protein MDAP_000378 [Mitosporidium daphniae]|uniref:Uncharacterized protein n=1 Tax=Mitosporidium daphniae TaxID=1485682 RepID=A0A098VQY4_9MICR|nr:uncharacterized protein DI09_38p200 [Mitosporidium daphniae]KGG51350.1 hypothetical protein DI09_38p200 [Mitosporidium daphniae]|eukprot:XP_013237777.1 uncharacterized protein DI09_38p200 [Mitosporidium daphniae]